MSSFCSVASPPDSTNAVCGNDDGCGDDDDDGYGDYDDDDGCGDYDDDDDGCGDYDDDDGDGDCSQSIVVVVTIIVCELRYTNLLIFSSFSKHTMKYLKQAIKQLKYSKVKSNLIATADDGGCVKIWDSTARKSLYSFGTVHTSPTSGVAFSPINKMLLLSCGLDKRIVLYDVISRKFVGV